MELQSALSGRLRDGTVAEMDEIASATALTADDSLRRDSCHRRRDSCLDGWIAPRGKKIVPPPRALDTTPMIPTVPPALRLEQISSPENRRRTALRHVSEHSRRVVVAPYSRQIIAGELATTEDTKPLHQCPSFPPTAVHYHPNFQPPPLSPIN
jgi:hypothetical protein